MPRLNGKIALITGASRGIGAAVARRFAEEGARVILVARTVGGLEATDDAIRKATGQSATLVPFDLSQHGGIDELGRSVFDRFGKLDILVGNAGRIETLGPVATFDPAAWTRVFDINVTANFRLIRAFDRLLRAADAGRAIFTGSGMADAAFPYWGAYGASKKALEVLVKTYAGETALTNLRVNLVDPGAVRTALRATAFPGEDASALPAPEAVTEPFVELAEASCTRHGQVVTA